MVGIKHCIHGNCRNDSRRNEKKLFFFIPFPKLCLMQRQNLVNEPFYEHTSTCEACNKCARWVKSLNRKNFTPERITKYSYICSWHFVGGKGPTEYDPDPIDPARPLDPYKRKFIHRKKSSLETKYRKSKVSTTIDQAAQGENCVKKAMVKNSSVLEIQPHFGVRRCAVPLCESSTRKTPRKIFFDIPKASIRIVWWEAMLMAKENCNSLKSAQYCCQDHFNLEEDVEHLTEYELMRNVSPSLKPGVLPHIFNCQIGWRRRFRPDLLPAGGEVERRSDSVEGGAFTSETNPVLVNPDLGQHPVALEATLEEEEPWSSKEDKYENEIIHEIQESDQDDAQLEVTNPSEICMDRVEHQNDQTTPVEKERLKVIGRRIRAMRAKVERVEGTLERLKGLLS